MSPKIVVRPGWCHDVPSRPAACDWYPSPVKESRQAVSWPHPSWLAKHGTCTIFERMGMLRDHKKTKDAFLRKGASRIGRGIKNTTSVDDNDAISKGNATAAAIAARNERKIEIKCRIYCPKHRFQRTLFQHPLLRAYELKMKYLKELKEKHISMHDNGN